MTTIGVLIDDLAELVSFRSAQIYPADVCVCVCMCVCVRACLCGIRENRWVPGAHPVDFQVLCFRESLAMGTYVVHGTCT